jgi:acyl dehydratase
VQDLKNKAGADLLGQPLVICSSCPGTLVNGQAGHGSGSAATAAGVTAAGINDPASTGIDDGEAPAFVRKGAFAGIVSLVA